MAQASAKKQEHSGHAEKRRVTSVSPRAQLASMPEPLLPKRKITELFVQKQQIVRWKRVKGGVQSGSVEKKGWTPQGKKAGSEVVRKGKQAKRASLGKVERSISGQVNAKAL